FLCSSLSAQNNVPAQKKHVSLNPYDFTIKDTANYIFFPNTQIQLKPPAHFVPYEKIHGFMHPGSSSTLQVTEIQGTPYVMYVKGLTEEYFAQQGIKLVNTENITTKNGNKAVIYTLSFTVKGIDYERMMMFTGDYDRTIWVNANYPVMTKFLLESVLKNSLLSVRF
ncbi:MAG: hypothetical protein A2309_13575, partial [Bacteroidetes bacterium RIFOXYB2_FULL_35_7]